MPRSFTDAQRQQYVEKFHQSGRSMKAFSRQEGISCSTLHHWVKCRDKPVFVELQPLPASEGLPATPVRLVLHMGIHLRLELAELPTPQWLAALTRALKC